MQKIPRVLPREWIEQEKKREKWETYAILHFDVIMDMAGMLSTGAITSHDVTCSVVPG